MDGLITNNLKVEEPDDDIMVGDNAMSVARGASFLMGDDPNKDPVKPATKASIGDAPMGEKPTENPLEVGRLSLSLGGSTRPDTSFGGDTTIAAASNLGPNPLGPNPFGLDFDDFGLQKKPTPAPAPVKEPVSVAIKEPAAAAVKEPTPAPVKEPTPAPVKEPTPAPVKEPAPAPVKEPAPAAVKEPAPAPVREPEMAEEQKAISMNNVVSVSEGSMIIFASAFFGNRVILDDDSYEEKDNYVPATQDDGAMKSSLEGIIDYAPSHVKVEEPKPLGESKKEDAATDSAADEPMGLTPDKGASDDEPMGLPLGADDFDDIPLGGSSSDSLPLGGSSSDSLPLGGSSSDNASNEKPQASAPKGVDPLMALLLAGGNPFGDNTKTMAPDLSFGKEALKPKHFEPMKASGPAVNAENTQANNPLGTNPFGKEIAPDFSFGKDALKPKRYVPKNSSTPAAEKDDAQN